MHYWVYVHTCKANGKRYVGVTTYSKPERRWGKNGEGYLYNDHFRSAILKHGWSNFQHEVFEVDSKEEMYRKEVELISFYHSNDPEYGYNNSVGGEKSALGCRYSEGIRKKMSETQKKRWLDPEYREKMLEARKDRPHKPFKEETKRKMSETAKERAKDPEVRRKRSEAARNRPRVKIKLPDGTIIERTKPSIVRDYVNKGKKFEYVS